MAGINFKRFIFDNVHGSIGLTELEEEVEKLPIFQRLRRIKQLGFGNFVFPGAEHTRYSHSLGVMHIADKMAMQLNFNDAERQLIRIAGLLHDIGHYPLSHVGEHAYKELSELITVEEDEKSVLTKLNEKASSIIKGIIDKDFIEKNNDSFLKKTIIVAQENFHHEKMGADVISNHSRIRELLHEHNIDFRVVNAIICGDVNSSDEIEKYVQILHSELDADRLDYLMRDAYSAGNSYGTFEFESLISNLTMVKANENNLEIDIVGINDKGIALVDQYLLNRFFAYQQVVNNEDVVSYNFIAHNVIQWMIQNKKLHNFDYLEKIIIELNDLCANSDYYEFTDSYILNQLKKYQHEESKLKYCKRRPKYLTRGIACDINKDPVIKTMIDKLLRFSKLEVEENTKVNFTGILNPEGIEQFKTSLKENNILDEKDQIHPSIDLERNVLKYNETYFTKQISSSLFIELLKKKFFPERYIKELKSINDNYFDENGKNIFDINFIEGSNFETMKLLEIDNLICTTEGVEFFKVNYPEKYHELDNIIDMWNKHLKHRAIEGLTVISDSKKTIQLVDHYSSMVHNLSRLMNIQIRSYKI